MSTSVLVIGALHQRHSRALQPAAKKAAHNGNLNSLYLIDILMFCADTYTGLAGMASRYTHTYIEAVNLGLNPDRAINCHHMDVKLGVMSAGISFTGSVVHLCVCVPACVRACVSLGWT